MHTVNAKALLVLALLLQATPGATHSETFFTSFEFSDAGTFDIGTPPLIATFSGGAAQTVGVGAYYHSGAFSWHVPSGGEATVTFAVPAEAIDFWFRDTQGASSSEYTVIDTEGATIGNGKGTQSFERISMERSGVETLIASIRFNSAGGGDTVVDDFSFTANENTPLPPEGPVNLNGEVRDASGTPLCAMVLASGQFQFTCNPNGPFSLNNLHRETDGTVKRQVYVDGFFPRVDILQGGTNQTVVMQRSGTCPNYNESANPGSNLDSAGDNINITGRVLQQDSEIPVCAMVLANGQFQFSCDGSGNYSLDIPLDNNGQFKLQVYADGFAPNIQVFDEFMRVNDVRLARASECN
jgi:hypothetical protein